MPMTPVRADSGPAHACDHSQGERQARAADRGVAARCPDRGNRGTVGERKSAAAATAAGVGRGAGGLRVSRLSASYEAPEAPQ